MTACNITLTAWPTLALGFGLGVPVGIAFTGLFIWYLMGRKS